MTNYLFFNSKEKLPSFDEILTFVYDDSFKNCDFCGGYFHLKKHEEPIGLTISWPKWMDNPDCPDYARFTRIHGTFSPLSRRDVKYNKRVIEKAKRLRYSHSALIWMGSAGQVIDKRPASVDIRSFHRLVFFLAKRTDSKIFDLKKTYSPDEYLKKYRKLIEKPFRRKLTDDDLER